MSIDYDTIVVGAGIAGLMTAVRLAHAGDRVLVLDERLIAAGATGKNQGIVHSGSVYSELHPELVPLCQQASSLFARHFPSAIINRNPTIHLLSPDVATRCKERFLSLGISCVDELPAAIHSLFHNAILNNKALLGVHSLTVSSTSVCASLAQMAVDAGAELHLHTPVHALIFSGRSVSGVLTSSSRQIMARRVILSSGSGIPAILARSGIPDDRFRTRADLMLTIPGTIDHPVVEYGFGGVYVVPTSGGCILASRFGGMQPFLNDSCARVDVPLALGTQLVASLNGLFQPSALRIAEATAYTCLKTELRQERADAWGVEPYHAVIDHGVTVGIRNLWSLLPGKMTFAFHATRELCSRLHGSPEPLELPVSAVEPTPWIVAQTAPAPADGIRGSAWTEASQP